MRLLMGTTSQRKLRSYCSFWLVFSILLIDCFGFLQHGVWRAQVAQAAVGDFSIFSETIGTEVIAGTGNILTWDNSVSENSNISLQANDSSIDLADGGKYLVLYNAWTEEGATGGVDRRSIASYVTINGVASEYGWGGGYIRDSEDDFTAYNSGAAILDVSPGDDLTIVLDRDDTNPGAGTAIRPNTNGVSILKIDDDLNYLRVHSSGGTGDISGNTAFTPVNFDTADEVDASSFTFSAPATGVTVSGSADQKFLVTTNVKLDVTGGGSTRQNYEMRLTLDGVEIPGTRSTAYLRSANGDYNSTLQYTGIIQKTITSDQTLAVEVRREGPGSTATAIVGDQTALAAVALPGAAEVLSLVTNTDQALTTTQSPFTFGTQISTSDTFLTHSTTTNANNISINTGGNYLVFATTYTSRTSGGGRDVPRIDWRIDGITQAYGGHGHFNRGDQGTPDAFTSGGSSGAIFPSLTSGQVIELTQQDETTGTPVSDFLSNRVAVQVLQLSELIADTTTNVLVGGAQVAALSPGSTDVFLGEQFQVIESDSARNVTNITLSEDGTIPADTILANVRLYYDLDTSAPYDCASESYAGDEAQFGATSTFNGVNGTVSFAGSETVSPTRSLCVYVVSDIATNAIDGQTVNVYVANASTDIVVTNGGTVSPPASVGVSFSTIIDPEVTQTNYHWRNDDGSETGATSATGGIENTPGTAFEAATPQRLRVGVAVAGTGSDISQYRLEYGAKVTTCEAVASWTSVDSVGGEWDMFDSTFVFEGEDTTNIPEASGGITDGAVTFITANGGVRDVTAQTGSITLNNEIEVPIAEFDTTTVTNGVLTTINLNEVYSNPVVVATARYPRTATQRTVRVDNKASSSFDVLVDNYDGSLTGTSVIDYVVIEAGDWLLEDGGTGTQVYAGSVDTAVTAGRPIPTDPGGPTVTFPVTFSGEPAVITTVVTRNDPTWVFSSVYQGTAITNPPSATEMRLFLNDNWDSDGHAATETIDYIVFDQGHETSNGFEFDAVTTGIDNVSSAPIAINYNAAYSAVPSIILTQSLTHFGGDGGYSQVDTNTSPTNSAVTVSTDEDGLGADRGHAAEEVGIISFAATGNFTETRSDLTEFIELEYSLQATGLAVEGQGYCFRLTDAGTPLKNYNNYPEATLNADVTVGQRGTQIATTDVGDSDVYIGGQFTFVSNQGNYTLNDLTVTQTGTIDAQTYLSNPRIAYDLDTTNPRDCVSESYDGTEPTIAGTGFFGQNGTTTVSLNQDVRTNQSVCAYVLVDVASTTPDGVTIDFEISVPNTDAVLAAGSVGPGTAVELSGSTLVQAPALSQVNYHWRNDDGSETGATSATAGLENSPVTNVFQDTTKRLRVAVANTGSLSKFNAQMRLEYGTKVTTCENVGVWQRVASGVAFDMASTSQLSDGTDTTDITEAIGGVSNSGLGFLSPNAGQEETTDQIAPISIPTTEVLEIEYALRPTDVSAFSATYCFRLTDAGVPLATYTNYPELTIQDRQDFLIQRGTETVSGTSLTLTAGVDYDAPSSDTAAFVRITNTSMTGAGSDTLGSTRNPDDVFAYIEGGDSLTTSFSIVRPPTATDNTRVSWEIVEYIGVTNADNEMIVRDAGTVTYGGTDLFATGTAVVGVADDADVLVLITGQYNPDANTNNYNTGLSVSSWNAATNQPIFERGDADGVTARVSYAVVEFTGASWNVQRAEHTYTAAGVTETQAITSVNSLLRTFVHAQKLSGDELFNLDESGHEVWLSSIGAVSFQLENGSTNPSEQRSVAWVVENTQTGNGSMEVYRSSGLIAQGGVQPITTVLGIGGTIEPANATIWATNRSTGAGNAHPRTLLGMRILNETQYELWKSDEGQNQNFRVEVVEWPVAETSVRQTHYRFYVNNDTLTPTDPWPVGGNDLGENTAMTDIDDPLGAGEQVRIRIGLLVNNASLVADSTAFKLQYARRTATCSAIGSWVDLDNPGGVGIWRGVDASPVDGTTLPSGLLSTTNVLGTYQEQIPSAINQGTIEIGEYIEYDWNIEHNGALQKSSYCFRMVYSDGQEIEGYSVYPIVRTTGYTPVIVNWRWFDDENSLTPNVALAPEQNAPIEIAASNTLKLRVAVTEVEGAPGDNIKFNLQYSQWADFRDGGTTLTSSSSCTGLTRTWCYADGAGVNNDSIDATVLTGVDSCVGGAGAGCGTVNEASGFSSTYDQPIFTTSEHEFTLLHDSVGFDQVYYFRMVDATNGVPLLASSSFPSLTTEGAAMTFTVSGLDAGQSFEGVTFDATTTATNINFGNLPFGTSVEAGQRLTVFANGTEGYRVYLVADQPMTNVYGDELQGVAGTNASPQPWASACTGGAVSCFGYHSGDNTLYDGSLRFALDDSYAALSTTPVEVMASGVPVTFDQSELIYRTQVSEMQPAGDYATTLQYIIVPIF